MTPFRRASQLLIFIALTILTQIGGLAYLSALALTAALGTHRRMARFSAFLVLYIAASLAAAFAAPLFGRVPLSCRAAEGEVLAVRSPLYCALNRQYVTPRMRDLATALAESVDREFPGTTTIVLDANFPFVDGFPLLPHLSHDDGRKLDLAFYYRTADGEFLNGATRSPIGYFAFEQPQAADDQPCRDRNDILTTRWDLNWLQPLFPAHEIEPQRTAFALRWLSTQGVTQFGLDRIFLEPHLRDDLGATDPAVRFQGCRAARHDDHIHIQIR